jgi:hypothetical protein
MANEDTQTVHITARVPRELATAFERVAIEQDRTVSAELRRAMRQHVDACTDGLRDHSRHAVG